MLAYIKRRRLLDQYPAFHVSVCNVISDLIDPLKVPPLQKGIDHFCLRYYNESVLGFRQKPNIEDATVFIVYSFLGVVPEKDRGEFWAETLAAVENFKQEKGLSESVWAHLLEPVREAG
jgi:hypothetical protein